MYSVLAERVIYPIGDLAIGTSVMKYYRWLLGTQWWSPEKLRELQNAKLRALIRHAYANVPHYRHLFDQLGITDEDIHTVDDLALLPILTKAEIRERPKEMLSRDFWHWHPIADATGGSTGEPLAYYITKDLASVSWAANFRGWSWAGYRMGDKRITFGGASLVPNERPTAFQTIRRRLERNLSISAFDIDKANIAKYVTRIQKFRPKFIYGYASALSLLAGHMIDNHVSIPRIQGVLSTAETLLPTYRQLIEKAFGCEVFDEYGSYDGGVQALECRSHSGHHISSEKMVLELVDEAGQAVKLGEPGRVLATDLHNFAMPFVRYDVGDIATMSDSPCPCGRGLPLLKSIQGRVSDFVVTPAGRKIHGEFFSHVLWGTDVVIQFQVEQTSRQSIQVRMVPRPGASDREQERERQRVMGLIRLRVEDMKVEVDFVKSVATTQGGKHKFIISRIEE